MLAAQQRRKEDPVWGWKFPLSLRACVHFHLPPPTPPFLACVTLFLAGDTSSIPFSPPSASAPCYGDTLVFGEKIEARIQNVFSGLLPYPCL